MLSCTCIKAKKIENWEEKSGWVEMCALVFIFGHLYIKRERESDNDGCNQDLLQIGSGLMTDLVGIEHSTVVYYTQMSHMLQQNLRVGGHNFRRGIRAPLSEWKALKDPDYKSHPGMGEEKKKKKGSRSRGREESLYVNLQALICSDNNSSNSNSNFRYTCIYQF